MNEVSEALLAWYDRNARVLPWRNIHDPYKTWVSEAMLQQTRVETVLSYYDRFLSRFPTLADLAGAEAEDVLKVWQGLGYYSRARNLWKGARQVMEEYGGKLPADPDKLSRISGIGEYTAGAIASIAYGTPVPAVDGNVIRVLSRLYGIRGDASRPECRRRIQDLAAALVPPERPGDHNQALMDLGATLCVPGTPDCRRCPLSGFCDAFRTGDAAELPLLPKAKAPRVVLYNVVLMRSGNRVLLRRRSEKLLEGLCCFPMLEGEPDRDALAARIRREFSTEPTGLVLVGTGRHVFTHRVWQMNIWACRIGAEGEAPEEYFYEDAEHLAGLPWPVAMESALDCLRSLAR